MKPGLSTTDFSLEGLGCRRLSEIGSGHYPGCPRDVLSTVPHNFATRRRSFTGPHVKVCRCEDEG